MLPDETAICEVIKDRYRLLRVIDEGGLGVVYQGLDETLHRQVAIKRLKAEHLENNKEEQQGWNEARTMAALNHPNVVTLHDFGEDKFGAFFVMEYVDGQTLDRWMERFGKLSPEEFYCLASQVLEGLCAAHAKGVIHRDIKPTNLMFMTTPSQLLHCKMLDFGLARFQRQLPQDYVRDEAVYGSVYYMAPELFERRPASARTDLYALGCVLYYSLTGLHPFEGESVRDVITAHKNHEVEPLQDLRDDLDPRVYRWMERLISFDPQERPASAKIALEDFYDIYGLNRTAVLTEEILDRTPGHGMQRYFQPSDGFTRVIDGLASPDEVSAARRRSWARSLVLAVVLLLLVLFVRYELPDWKATLFGEAEFPALSLRLPVEVEKPPVDPEEALSQEERLLKSFDGLSPAPLLDELIPGSGKEGDVAPTLDVLVAPKAADVDGADVFDFPRLESMTLDEMDSKGGGKATGLPKEPTSPEKLEQTDELQPLKPLEPGLRLPLKKSEEIAAPAKPEHTPEASASEKSKKSDDVEKSGDASAPKSKANSPTETEVGDDSAG